MPLFGAPSSPTVTIHENHLRYQVRPYEGFSTGIFLDQRENRLALAAETAGMKVLNCFSYTCAFSVACAKGGALVTSVDLSKKYLEWGKENFLLNSLDVSQHRFVERDVFRFFRSGVKKGETYDLVILDPPSFSRTKEGDVFSIRKDLGRLLESAEPLVTAGGRLFFSSNYSGWETEFVKGIAVKSLTARKCQFEKLTRHRRTSNTRLTR